MDWLHTSNAVIDGKTHRVKFQIPSESILEWKGTNLVFKGKLISHMKARKFIPKRCIYHILWVKYVESKDPTIDSVPIIDEFPNVFLDDLSSIPPKKINFGIDLLLDTQLIFIPPYRMAPTELEELMEWLRYLLDKEFKRTSMSS